MIFTKYERNSKQEDKKVCLMVQSEQSVVPLDLFWFEQIFEFEGDEFVHDVCWVVTIVCYWSKTQLVKRALYILRQLPVLCHLSHAHPWKPVLTFNSVQMKWCNYLQNCDSFPRKKEDPYVFYIYQYEYVNHCTSNTKRWTLSNDSVFCFLLT